MQLTSSLHLMWCVPISKASVSILCRLSHSVSAPARVSATSHESTSADFLSASAHFSIKKHSFDEACLMRSTFLSDDVQYMVSVKKRAATILLGPGREIFTSAPIFSHISRGAHRYKVASLQRRTHSRLLVTRRALLVPYCNTVHLCCYS